MCRTEFLFIACSVVFFLDLGTRARSEGTDPELGVSIDNTIVCQGKLLKLRCHNSALTLTIYSATFGRTEPGGQICPYEAWAEDMDFLCAESDVTTRLQRICSRRTKCRIQVERSVFGRDLCPGKHLYLRVIYGCEYKKPKKNPSTKGPGLSPTATPIDTGIPPQSTQETPPSGVVNLTTAALQNSTDRPSTSPEVPSSNPTSSLPLTLVALNITQPPGHQRTGTNTEPSVTPPAVMVQQSVREPVGAWAPLTVCFLVLEGNLTSMLVVFFAGVTGAFLLSIIVAVIVYRRVVARRNHQHAKVIEVPKLNSSSGPPSPSDKVPTTVLVPSAEPRLIHPGTLARHPGTVPRHPATSDFYVEYSSAGNKEPTSSRNVVPRLVIRPPSEIYRKDLNTDRVCCARAKNDVSGLEMYPLLAQDGLRMIPKAEYADCILPVNEPRSKESS